MAPNDVAAALREGDERMTTLAEEIAAIKLEQEKFRADLAENTSATKRIETNTAEMLDVFASWVGAMKTLDMLGKLAKPLGYLFGLGASAAAFWAALKSGTPPK